MDSRLLTISILVIAALAGTEADVYFEKLIYGSDGNAYCATRGIHPKFFTIGGQVETTDCYRCTCGLTGMRCEGYGIKYGSYAQHVPVPKGCTLVIKNDCSFYFVRTYDGVTRC